MRRGVRRGMRGSVAAAMVGAGLCLAPAHGEPLALPDGAPVVAEEARREAPAPVKPQGKPDTKAEARPESRPEPRAPYLAMRELEQMQDRIAAGDTLAAAAHAKAIHRTASAFAAAKPAAWAEPRNARALVLYLFSGGDSAAIGSAIPRSALPKAMADLYEGALDYGLGDDARARDKLAAIDPKGLPAALGGHLALVQAALAADPAKAIERLDLARLLAPGTLVEEAALRKELGLVDLRNGDPKAGDLAKFALLARRYAASFPRSTYRGNFKQLVRQAALAVAAGDDTGTRLAVVVESLDARERHQLLLAVARDALAAGRMAMAATAASQVLGASPAATAKELARAQVYLGAATIAGPRHEAARAALAAATGLDGNDEALRLAALSVADTIHDPAFAAAPARGEADAAAIRDGERALGEAEAAMKVATR